MENNRIKKRQIGLILANEDVRLLNDIATKTVRNKSEIVAFLLRNYNEKLEGENNVNK